jgi:replicative DNA helicase Mcm
LKEAVIYQLFGGTRKTLADGRVTRGESHILICGDPGIAKCISKDTNLRFADGTRVRIEDVWNRASTTGIAPVTYNDDVGYAINDLVLSMNGTGKIQPQHGAVVWKRTGVGRLLEITTRSGRYMKVTPTHPLLHTTDGYLHFVPAQEFGVGDFIGVSRNNYTEGSPQRLDGVEYKKSNQSYAVKLMLPEHTSPEFWRYIALILGEGCISNNEVRFTNQDMMLLDEVIAYSGELGMRPHISKNKSCFDVRIPCREFSSFMMNLVGRKSHDKYFPEWLFRCTDDEKCAALGGIFDAEGSVNIRCRNIEISTSSIEMSKQLQTLLTDIGILSTRTGWFNKRYNHTYFKIRVTGKSIQRFYDIVPFKSVPKQEKMKEILSNAGWNTNTDIIPNTNETIRHIRKELGMLQRDVHPDRSPMVHYEKGDRNPSRDMLKRISSAFLERGDTVDRDATRLRALSESDIFWDQIQTINEIITDEEVYDVELPMWHNYIADDFIMHNTALGMYAATVAPRGMFASGKSSSAAGLTAAVVKDTMKKDSWAFEIGVLPKADGGVAIIDEIDKMRPEDVSSMNEALESQHISLNKAGVSVTISTRTAVLGLCNPKYGRFDPNEDMMEQVNMNDTLLSRFDLIFLEKDKPLNGLDESICDQILDNHRGVVTKNDDIIDTELFRKYIAMGKKLNPTLSNEASDLIKKHYLSNRKKSGNDGVMKITARQLEAFIRLSEASARVRLSDTITAEDAQRAINLFSLAMSKISTDGDVDVVMSGVGKKTRNALSDIKEMFRCAPNGMLKEVELLAQCEAKGISSDEMDKCVEKLRYKGDLIMPRRGTYQLDDRR